jgi:carboxyl-terminal processing protease
VDEAICKGAAHGHGARMVKRIINIGLGVIAGYLMTLGVVQVVQAWGFWPDRETAQAAERVREVMVLLNRHYVDAPEVAGDKLATRAIESMVGELDPYSQFMDAAAHRHLDEEMDSKFGGIGVQIEGVEGKVTVVAPITGTPGARAGILRGDVIVKVDGDDVREQKMDKVIGRLRGKPGTDVTLTVERGAPPREIEFKLKRELIKVESVDDVTLLDGGIGYIRIALFAERTGEDFKAAVKKLRSEGMRALLIDLRNNPGGLLTAAVEVVEPFFPRGELVVYTEGRQKGDREELFSEGETEPLKLPIAILVNGGSASAAEIVAGALKDTDRAVLVGEKTFGKGSVQSIFPLRADAALRVTTAKYYTPSGVTIHGKGIVPDIVEPLTPEQEKAVFLARLRPDVTDPEVFEKRFGVAMAKDTQLAAARRELEAELAGAPPTRRATKDTATEADGTGTPEVTTGPSGTETSTEAVK